MGPQAEGEAEAVVVAAVDEVFNIGGSSLWVVSLNACLLIV